MFQIIIVFNKITFYSKQGGYECGEKVINVLHTPDGNAVSKYLLSI